MENHTTKERVYKQTKCLGRVKEKAKMGLKAKEKVPYLTADVIPAEAHTFSEIVRIITSQRPGP